MKEMWTRLRHRSETAADLLGFIASRRPWLVPIVIGLLCMTGFVALAQASQISPFIYTLF